MIEGLKPWWVKLEFELTLRPETVNIENINLLTFFELVDSFFQTKHRSPIPQHEKVKTFFDCLKKELNELLVSNDKFEDEVELTFCSFQLCRSMLRLSELSRYCCKSICSKLLCESIEKTTINQSAVLLFDTEKSYQVYLEHDQLLWQFPRKFTFLVQISINLNQKVNMRDILHAVLGVKFSLTSS